MLNIPRHVLAKVCCLFVLQFLVTPGIWAEYFAKDAFKTYTAGGEYPFWSKSWVPLGNRIDLDREGIPYVKYREGTTYNATTISLFGLLAYNRYLESLSPQHRTEFLRFAQWLVDHQKSDCGCWYHELEVSYFALDEVLHPPWPSAMTQGLAMSVLTRAYLLTREEVYLHAAEKSLLPFLLPVEQGGVLRNFSLLSLPLGAQKLLFYEEYPTQPQPSFTLNGFMYALLGLYDLSHVGNQQAQELFQKGAQTLRVSLPLYDMGDGSSYDLVHLTRPPRAVHRDNSYHLIHVFMLNALGTATGDAQILWYRDKWNSYGMPVEKWREWIIHFAIWLVFRHKYLLGTSALLFLALGIYGIRVLWSRNAKPRKALPSMLEPSESGSSL